MHYLAIEIDVIIGYLSIYIYLRAYISIILKDISKHQLLTIILPKITMHTEDN